MTEPDAYDHETHKDDEVERWIGGGVRKDRIESWPEERVKPLYALETFVEMVIQLWRDTSKLTLEGEAKELRNGAEPEDVAEMLEYVAKNFEKELKDEFLDKAGKTERDTE